jgi:hypothetical protein
MNNENHPCLSRRNSGIVSLAFPAAAQLVFTEIHYHPVEGPAFNADGTPCHHLTNDIHEFVEIQNASGATGDIPGLEDHGADSGLPHF